MLRRALALLGFVAAMLAATDSHAERRVALVVGNAQYEHATSLRNPMNDAKDMGALLKNLGFEVIIATDLDQGAFARQIDEFGRMLEGADVGLFFYAGHGLQVNGKNYLVSTQAKLENEFLIPAETVELDAIIRLMESRTSVNLVFLDACRNNPLAERLRQNLLAANRSVSLGRGLARVETTGRDTLIAFAAAPGQEAADGRDRNSPFTAALLQHVPEPGVEVSVMLKRVNAQVRRDTNNAQRPQQVSDMSRTFYFAKASEPTVAASPPTPAPAPAPAPDHSIEVAYWNSARSADNCEAVRAYLDRYPDGIFVDLAKLSERRLCEASRKVTVVDTQPPSTESQQAPGTAAGQSQAASPPSASPSDSVSPRTPATTEPAPAPPAKETKVAALPDPSAVDPEPEPDGDNSATAAELARDLQRELARVGCSAGRPDGIWGARSRAAIRLFNRHAQASLDPDVPSKEALAALQERRGPVCPRELRPPREKATPSTPSRSKPQRVQTRVRPSPLPALRGRATTKDWRSISPLCESAYYVGGKLCCTHDPPGLAPQIICP